MVCNLKIGKPAIEMIMSKDKEEPFKIEKGP